MVPPADTYGSAGTRGVRGTEPSCRENPRSPAAPADWPVGASVYHVRKKNGDTGFTSNRNPCPEVATSYQLPDKPKSALVIGAVPTVHVTLGKSRVSGIVPARPLPSDNV